VTKKLKIACSPTVSYVSTYFPSAETDRESDANRCVPVKPLQLAICLQAPVSHLEVVLRRKNMHKLCASIILQKLEVASLQKLYPLSKKAAENIISAWENCGARKELLVAAIFKHIRFSSEFKMRLEILYAFWISSNLSTSEEAFHEWTHLLWSHSRLGCLFTLCHESGVKALKEYTREKKNSENIFFFLLASDYESMPEDLRLQSATQIVQLFLSRNSDSPVNIETRVCRKIIERLSQSSDHIPSNIFHEAQEKILSIITQGPFAQLAVDEQKMQLVQRQIYQEVCSSIMSSKIKLKLSKMLEFSL